MKFFDFHAVPEVYRRAARNSGDRVVTKLDDQDCWRLQLAATLINRGLPKPDEDQDEGLAAARQLDLSWLAAERKWGSIGRPFYNVWPAAVDALSRIDLSKITGDMLRPPLPALLMRFPETGGPVSKDGIRTRTALVGFTDSDELRLFTTEDTVRGFDLMAHLIGRKTGVTPTTRPTPLEIVRRENSGRSLIFVMNTGETRPQDGTPTHSLRFITLTGASIRDALGQADDAPCLPEDTDTLRLDLLDQMAAIYASVCLLDQDSGLLDRIVLAADREAFARTGDDRYVEKAAKRGVRGWDVGRRLQDEVDRGETSPHFRRPHFGIRLMGARPNLKPVIRPIKGAIVRRDKLVSVPTGYADQSAQDDLQEQE